jgi:nitrite reductase/ring-hydroxylating ferredoxin subunit
MTATEPRPGNPARPVAGTRLCAVDELADPGAKTFRYREGDYLFQGFVVKRDGAVFGYIDRCPHTGLPLELFGRYLTQEGDQIICASHGALFTPETGYCVAGPCAGRSLWPWPVAVCEGEIFTA